MKFSKLFLHTSNLVSWSPDDKFFAVGCSSKLQVYHAESLVVKLTFIFNEVIQTLTWSPDSKLICLANYKHALVELCLIDDPSWTCKIEEGGVGLLAVCWSPDSRHILTTADFHLRMTVWSLVGSSVSYIRNPKQGCSAFAFNHAGDYLAVAEREDCKDYLSIYDATSWVQLKHFEVDTFDLQGIKWAPNDCLIAVWDSLLECKALIYDLGGQCLCSFTPYRWGPGIGILSWAPTNQFLAVGSGDNKVRLLNNITWRVLVEFSHTSKLEKENFVLYKEEPKTGDSRAFDFDRPKSTYVEERSRPVVFEPGSPDENAAVGVRFCCFSPDGRYLATVAGDFPGVVWVWKVFESCLASILSHRNHVQDLQWCPRKSKLAVCTGVDHVFFWTPFGAVSVCVPSNTDLQINKLGWNSVGSRLLLIGRDKTSVCIVDEVQSRVKRTENW